MNIKVQDRTYFFLDDDNGDGTICDMLSLDEGCEKAGISNIKSVLRTLEECTKIVDDNAILCSIGLLHNVGQAKEEHFGISLYYNFPPRVEKLYKFKKGIYMTICYGSDLFVVIDPNKAKLGFETMRENIFMELELENCRIGV